MPAISVGHRGYYPGYPAGVLSYINMLIWPIRQMGRILSGMGRALVSVERIEEILEVPEETQDPDCVKAY